MPCRVVTIAVAAAKQMNGCEEAVGFELAGLRFMLNGVQFGVRMLTQFGLLKMLPGLKKQIVQQSK